MLSQFGFSVIITHTYLLIIFLNSKINLHSVSLPSSDSPIRNQFAISLEMFQKQNSVVAVCSMVSRETADVGSNVTFLLLIPHLKVKMQCVSVKLVLNRSVPSLSAHQPLGKCNLKAISGLQGIAFNLGLSWGLVIWRE